MKLAYERPMMHAEMYQTNAYCYACTDGNFLINGAINLANAVGWLEVNRHTNQTGYPFWYAENTDKTGYSDYTGLSFSNATRVEFPSRAQQYYGAAQYYWSTELNGSRYYLEYSVEHNNNASDMEFEAKKDGVEYGAFILYKEDTVPDQRNDDWWDNGYAGSANTLEINWGGYRGSNEDNDATDKYDNSLFAVLFENRQVAAS